MQAGCVCVCSCRAGDDLFGIRVALALSLSQVQIAHLRSCKHINTSNEPVGWDFEGIAGMHDGVQRVSVHTSF